MVVISFSRIEQFEHPKYIGIEICSFSNHMLFEEIGLDYGFIWFSLEYDNLRNFDR